VKRDRKAELEACEIERSHIFVLTVNRRRVALREQSAGYDIDADSGDDACKYLR
jgi:hypothetical protein